MHKKVPKEIITTNLLEFPALKAWRELRPELAQPEKIEVIKGRRETARKRAYRLAGAGPEGSPIIAKWCRRAKALIERTIYEEVLPYVPIPALRYYGLVEDTGGEFCWLFLEDAGEERYSPFTEEHRRLAARWLGLLHTHAPRATPAARLPDQGPDYYFERLRSGRDRILGNLANPALNAEDLAVLETILAQLEILESRWRQVERLFEGMPRTVVHGDFSGKNLRLRIGASGTLCLPFDWGDAGWGVPAIDLAQSPVPVSGFAGNPDIGVYWEVVHDHWPSLNLQTIQQWANLATMLRATAAINWDATKLVYEWVERPMTSMRVYRAAMAYAMQAAGWAG